MLLLVVMVLFLLVVAVVVVDVPVPLFISTSFNPSVEVESSFISTLVVVVVVMLALRRVASVGGDAVFFLSILLNQIWCTLLLSLQSWYLVGSKFFQGVYEEQFYEIESELSKLSRSLFIFAFETRIYLA